MTNFDYFVKRFRNRELLLDTNLLIVLLIGRTNKTFLEKIKTTKAYTIEDYDLLKKLINNFQIVTTPHILAEASNLCEKIEKFYKEKIFQVFSEIILNVIEIPQPSKDVVSTPIFMKFGMTDSVIIKLSHDGLIVLTDDFDLHNYLLGTGATAANMNLFRGEKWMKN